VVRSVTIDDRWNATRAYLGRPGRVSRGFRVSSVAAQDSCRTRGMLHAALKEPLRISCAASVGEGCRDKSSRAGAPLCPANSREIEVAIWYGCLT